MTEKHLVSSTKFKKLYFYKFLFAQIWYGFSFIELLIIAFILPRDLSKSLLNSNIVYVIFIPMFISTILWVLSLVWYFDKTAINRDTYIQKKGEDFVFHTMKQLWQFYSRVPKYDSYTYIIKNISNVYMGKYSITVYGDITLKRSHAFYPKTLVGVKQCTHVKIPNVFEDIALFKM